MLQGQWHQLEPPASPNSPQSTAPAVPPSRTRRSTRRHKAPIATGEGLRSAWGTLMEMGASSPALAQGNPAPKASFGVKVHCK